MKLELGRILSKLSIVVAATLGFATASYAQRLPLNVAVEMVSPAYTSGKLSAYNALEILRTATSIGLSESVFEDSFIKLTTLLNDSESLFIHSIMVSVLEDKSYGWEYRLPSRAMIDGLTSYAARSHTLQSAYELLAFQRGLVRKKLGIKLNTSLLVDLIVNSTTDPEEYERIAGTYGDPYADLTLNPSSEFALSWCLDTLYGQIVEGERLSANQLQALWDFLWKKKGPYLAIQLERVKERERKLTGGKHHIFYPTFGQTIRWLDKNGQPVQRVYKSDGYYSDNPDQTVLIRGFNSTQNQLAFFFDADFYKLGTQRRPDYMNALNLGPRAQLFRILRLHEDSGVKHAAVLIQQLREADDQFFLEYEADPESSKFEALKGMYMNFELMAFRSKHQLIEWPPRI